MNLLTLNTLSNENIETKEEVDVLLLQLVYGIKNFLSRKEYQDSRFYTEEKNILNFELIEGYSFKEAMSNLKREVLEPFSIFVSRKCDSDCLNKLSDNEMERILDDTLYFDNEAFDGQKYIILSYCLEKKTFLLSFGKNRWEKYKVIAHKIQKNGTSEKVILNNIANEEHSKNHYNDIQFDKLPKENIFYSEEFKEWFLSFDASIIEKIISKINESKSQAFNVDGFLIKSIQDDIFQIKIGTQGGLQQSAIRVLLKKDTSGVYILHGFVKQGETTYNYSTDIAIAKKNYTKLTRTLLNGI